MSMTDLITAARVSKAWPFQEAQQISRRRSLQGDRPVLFQTGFGPSGLPHIGTFAEVARTNWVRRACEHLSGTPARFRSTKPASAAPMVPT